MGGVGSEGYCFRQFLKRGFSFFRERKMKLPNNQAATPLAMTRRFHSDLHKKTIVNTSQMTESTPIDTKNSAFKYRLFSSLYRFS